MADAVSDDRKFSMALVVSHDDYRPGLPIEAARTVVANVGYRQIAGQFERKAGDAGFACKFAFSGNYGHGEGWKKVFEAPDLDAACEQFRASVDALYDIWGLQRAGAK